MAKPLCFVLMPFGKKPGGRRRDRRLRRGLPRPDRARGRSGRPGAVARGRGAGRRHHPQADVRAADPVRLRGRRSHHRQRQRVLRARRAPRRPAVRARCCSSPRAAGCRSTSRRCARCPTSSAPTASPADVAGDAPALDERLARGDGGATSTARCSSWSRASPTSSDMKTDVFRERVGYSSRSRSSSRRARKAQGRRALRSRDRARRSAPLDDAEAGVVVDLFLSYRAVKAWNDMIALVGEDAEPLRPPCWCRSSSPSRSTATGDGEEAERVLLDADRAARAEQRDLRHPRPRLQGPLGSRGEAGRNVLARGLLDKAIDAYLRGFEADWRDAYPGINAVTLMELQDPPDPRRADADPGRRLRRRAPDRVGQAGLLGPRHAARARGARRR